MEQQHTDATTSTTPATPETPASATSKHCDSIVDTMVDVGAAWVAYGLKVGMMALETSATTLEKTARALDHLAVELEKRGRQGAPRA